MYLLCNGIDVNDFALYAHIDIESFAETLRSLYKKALAFFNYIPKVIR